LTFAVAGIAGSARAQDVLYVSNDGRVSRVDGQGVRTVASGFNLPNGLALDAAGNLFVAQGSAEQITKVTPNGLRTTFVSNIENPSGLAFDEAGNLYAASLHIGTVWKIIPSGSVSPFVEGLDHPYDLAFDRGGNLYVSNFGINRNDGFITRVSPSGESSVFASSLDHPFGLAFNTAGELFVANFADNGAEGNIVRITPDGAVRPFAQVNSPGGLAFGPRGDLYVSNHFLSTVSRVSPDGQVTLYASGVDAARDLIWVPEPAGMAFMVMCGIVLLRRVRPAGKSSAKHVRASFHS
jgi:sugar lactone lactonase YvrE